MVIFPNYPSSWDHNNRILVVQLIGARKQAEQFAYRLELNGHRRRLTWEATPRSIHEGVARYETNSDNHKRVYQKCPYFNNNF